MVIGVYESEILAGGGFDAGVTSSGKTSVFLGEDFDTGVFFGICFKDSGGIVGGTVVDANNFEILISLIDDGI